MTYEEKLAERAARGDHTKIALHIDPRERRMQGIAHHGHTPFNVPFISQIDGNLWQGGCSKGLVLPSEIVNVVSLYPWEQYTVHHELRSQLYVLMYDSEDQGFAQVDSIARWAVGCLAIGPTLIHCQAGLNRSSLIAARVLMLAHEWSADEAIRVLREKRSPAVLCNPAFEEWLRAL